MSDRNFKQTIPSLDMVESDSYSFDDVAYDVVKLPSKGRLYPIDHPLHKKEVVEFKAMTAEEENILTTPALLKQGTVLNVLMKACLMDKEIDPLSLLLGDKSAILMAIRISGFGPEYNVKIKCSSCDNSFDHQFDLSKIEIKELRVAPSEEGKNLFEYVLPQSKKKIKFSLPIDRDDLEVIQMQQNRKKFVKSALIDTTVTDRLSLAVKEVDGKTDPDFLAKFVRKMPARDSRSLRGYISKIEPDLIMRQDVICKHCGVSTSHVIPLSSEFFWPQIED